VDREKAIKYMHDLLRMMVQKDGSDLFITAGAMPSMKVDGAMKPLSSQALSQQHTQVLVASIMNDKQRAEFDETQECNFAINLPGVSRFRVNAFTQRGSVGVVLRVICSEIPNFDDLGLPPILKDIAMTKRGLVIFVGATGSGKSTSLAAMVGFRNENSFGHIITIQREVGVDTDSYEIALKNTLRQAPDVILIGEIRDRETMEHAIAFAETGHLCLSTLHANSTNQALDRIINFFPEDRRQQLLMDLSLNLKGLISPIEIMINTPLMSDMIFKGNVHDIKELIAKSNELGMQTFDQALFDLYEAGEIKFEDALRNADSINDLRLRVKLEGKGAKKNDLMEGLDDITMEDNDDDARIR